jgi:prepilin-type processing-associated H-X9-DG protein
VIVAAAVVSLVLLVRARQIVNRARCADNLRSLGQAILLYCNENHWAYPPNWGTLAVQEDITSEVFICGNRSLTAPRNLTPAQFGDWITANSDYVYLAGNLPFGWSPQVSPQVVLAYERTENHDGINVLFQDGHVAFFNRAEADKVIAQLSRHVNPPQFESEGKHVGLK